MSTCFHCKDPIKEGELILFNEKLFCCNGCKFVFGILNSKGLEDYYEHKGGASGGRPDSTDKAYKYLDHEEFIQEYCIEKGDHLEFSFYIEGIHCTACLWLLERLSKLDIGVIESDLNMSTSVLKVSFGKEASLAQIAEQITVLGYRPHPILKDSDKIELEKQENKTDLTRIGVAFTCAGNIMLYSFSVYLGAPEKFSQYFNLFSFLCSFPILFYCSIPFYTSAIRSIKNKTINVDIPIVIVLILSFLFGAFSLVTDYEFFYFDTISTLVFLLLCSRYALKTINKKSLKLDNVINQISNQIACKIQEEGQSKKTIEVLASYLDCGDEIIVAANSIVPCDCSILDRDTFVNNAALSGESYPVKMNVGDTIYMGAVNLSQDIHCKVKNRTTDSRLGRVLLDIEGNWNKKTSLVKLIDLSSRYFTYTVLSLSLFFFLYFFWFESFEIAINRSFSLLLITCPCALALSTPLALVLSLNLFLKNSIFVKDEEALERVTKVKNVFLDKTGTLTDGEFKVFNFDLNSDVAIKNLKYIYSLEKRSHHPIAKSIIRYIEDNFSGSLESLAVEFDSFFEIPGFGLRGKIGKDEFEVSKNVESNNELNEISFLVNKETKFNFNVCDSLNRSAYDFVEFLKSIGVKPFILSGDKKSAVFKVANLVGIDENDSFYDQSPEDKAKIIQKYNNSMMIGDGVNDSDAIRKAFLGVAVSGSVESSLKASDIYIAKSKIESIKSVFKGAYSTKNIIKRNLILSFAYNIVGVYLAFNGIVTPLIAAIFMPVSSVTILLSTVLSVRGLKRVINEK